MGLKFQIFLGHVQQKVVVGPSFTIFICKNLSQRKIKFGATIYTSKSYQKYLALGVEVKKKRKQYNWYGSYRARETHKEKKSITLCRLLVI